MDPTQSQEEVADLVQLQVPISRVLQAKLKVVAMYERKTIRDTVVAALEAYLKQAPIQIRIDPKDAFTGEPSAIAWTRYPFPGGKGSGFCLAHGDMISGFECRQPGPARLDSAFLREILTTFAGETIAGGFQRDPPKKGLGYWVADNSGKTNSLKLGPIHACHIAAILIMEAGVEAYLDGPHRRVMLKFPPKQ